MPHHTLILLRHAKAEPGSITLEDAQRPLTARGKVDALTIGNYMLSSGLKPQVTLCSSAIRTQETYQFLREGFSELPEAALLDGLYHASVNQILHIIREAPFAAQTLLVIGHNPGLHQLAVELAQESSAHYDYMLAYFPTAACAVLRFSIASWEEIAKATGELVDFVTPKKLTLAA